MRYGLAVMLLLSCVSLAAAAPGSSVSPAAEFRTKLHELKMVFTMPKGFRVLPDKRSADTYGYDLRIQSTSTKLRIWYHLEPAPGLQSTALDVRTMIMAGRQVEVKRYPAAVKNEFGADEGILVPLMPLGDRLGGGFKLWSINAYRKKGVADLFVVIFADDLQIMLKEFVRRPEVFHAMRFAL